MIIVPKPEKSRRPLLLGAVLAVLVSLILLVGLIWRHEVRLRHEEKSRKDSVGTRHESPRG